jgi:hypothetical protein
VRELFELVYVYALLVVYTKKVKAGTVAPKVLGSICCKGQPYQKQLTIE